FATETPLVGRDHEMRWARGTWRQVRRGYGRGVAVSGPSQVGKTRLAAELASYVDGSVWYAGAGGNAPAGALAGVGLAKTTDARTLVILDDVDATGSELAGAVTDALDAIRDRPSMLLMLAQDPDDSPSLSALVERIDVRQDGHRRLSPLDQLEVQEIAHTY